MGLLLLLLAAYTWAAPYIIPGCSDWHGPGNILYTDFGNNGVAEVSLDPSTFNRIQDQRPGFHIGYFDGCDGSGNTPNGPVWASPITNLFNGTATIVVTNGFDGCPDNRVILYDCQLGENAYNCNDNSYDGNPQVAVQFGDFAPGSGMTGFNQPSHAVALCSDFEPEQYGVFISELPCPFDIDIMVTDTGNNRIVVLDLCRGVLEWEYGPTSGPGALNRPTMTQQLGHGNILIADTGNNRVIEITPQGRLVNIFKKNIPGPTFVSRMDGMDSHVNLQDLLGSELITIPARSSFQELNALGHYRFEYTGNGAFASPRMTVRVIDDNLFLVADNVTGVFLINRHKSEILYNMQGISSYSALMMGQDTGLTKNYQQCTFG